MKHQKTVMAGAIFLVALFWSMFLFQGLPASDIDDWDKIVLSGETPWGQFASSFLTPWSQSHNWVGQTDRNDEVHYKRIILPMALKLSQQCFGLNSFAMYFLTKGLFFAGCVALVFLMLTQVVPLLYATLGTLVFLFVPAHYTHVLWIADTVTLCYFFLFLGIWIFYALQRNILGRGSNRQFQWLLLALFVTGWIGIKAKEPMLVLPMVVFIYSVFRFRSWKQGPVKFLLLNAAMALVAFQIVPITNLSGNSVPSFNFSWTTLGRLLFLNYGCGYDNEKVSAFFSWGHVFPVSVARTLGFFVLWSMVVSLGVLGWQKWTLKGKEMVRFWSHPLIQICGIWFLVELPFLGMFQPDPRYFSGTMAPVIILSARLLYCAAQGMSRFFLWGLLAFAFFSVGFNICENAQHSLSVRIMLGRKLNYLSETPRTVLEDLRGGKTFGEIELGKFYCSLNDYRDQPWAIRHHMYYADLGISYEGWNKVPLGQDSLDGFELLAKEGYNYYVTLKELDLSGKSEIKLIGTVDGMNKDSLFERLFFKKKKKRPFKVKIYKYD